LAAVDANCPPLARVAFGALFACQRGAPLKPAPEVRTDLPQIELSGVTKSYGHGPAVLQSLDLTVCRQEFVSIIGPSGCGKSTILKLISGLTAPTAGTIRVEGMTPKNARESVSYVFLEATLLPWRTVSANIGLSLELEGVANDRRKKKVASLLALVGLDQVANAYPRELSGGMKMRVSIARALATSPRLLLLDEPFAALDEMSRDRLNEEILRLRSEQKWAAVFVTHSVVEAAFLSDRIVVLAPNPGRIHAVFPVDLPSPRVASMRTSPEFDSLVARVSHALRETLAA
jgi:NitT/TauT family transport system ATP-binding protein